MISAPERTERKLEESGRITPREVLAAYEETGLLPIIDHMIHGNYACAIGVLLRSGGYEFDNTPQVSEMLRSRGLKHGANEYGWGVEDGFDGYPKPRGKTHSDRLGWRDGRRARHFVADRYPDVLESIA